MYAFDECKIKDLRSYKLGFWIYLKEGGMEFGMEISVLWDQIGLGGKEVEGWRMTNGGWGWGMWVESWVQLRLGQPEFVHVRLDFKLDRVGHYEVKSPPMLTQIQLEFSHAYIEVCC